MEAEAREDRPSALYIALVVTIFVTCSLIAAMLAPVRNRLLSPRFGAELRTPNGAPVPLDEPVNVR